MEYKADYLAFTVPLPSGTAGRDDATWLDIQQRVDAFLGGIWQPIVSGHSWQRYDSKGFYHTRVMDQNVPISLSWGETNAHVYVEFSGVACDHVRNLNIFEDLLQAVRTRASRIDLAVDIEADCKPEDFIVNNDRRGFKSHSSVYSEDGETQYIGSRKSEIFARVYRYHVPHPRAHLLRVEVECKGDRAKQAIDVYVREGLVSAVEKAHAAFQWKHPLWRPQDAKASRIAAKKSDRAGSSTIRWLSLSVAPSLIRAHKEGLIHAGEWFDTFVKPFIQE